ncbi:hypothetical protein AAE478_006923 [Parahypoxylon ruwenzoriense]
MQFTSSLTTLLLLSAGASATSCVSQPPSAIGFPINFDITPSRPNTVTFQIPGGSSATGPCALVARFPPGYPVTSTGSDLVDVTALDGPAQGALVGSLRFRAGEERTVNSFACRDTFTFELSIAQGDGEVAFAQTLDAGLFIDVGDC